MTILRYVLPVFVILCIQHSAFARGETPGLEFVATPPVPPEIEVPADNTAYLKGHAIGTQNYICLPTSTGSAWAFMAPQATLFLTYKLLHNEIRQQIATHFLSPNLDENGTPRPTWQGSLDTSTVWGKALASSTNTSFVAPGAIPWLLVQIVGSERGSLGGALLTPTSFNQRLNTSGGSAPSNGCSVSTDGGKLALVPYTADYFFYRSDNHK